jgi:hypothetical protein
MSPAPSKKLETSATRTSVDPAWSAAQDVGTVVGTLGDRWLVRVASESVEARRALSCLVAPELGDAVLVASHREGVHVLAVLDRPSEGPLHLAIEGDARLAATGQLRLEGQEGVQLVTPGPTTLAVGSLEVASASATFALGAVEIAADVVESQIERLRTKAKTIETVAERSISRFREALRIVSDWEQVRAGYLEYAARSVAHIRAKAAVITSEEVTKVDGAQIHLG